MCVCVFVLYWLCAADLLWLDFLVKHIILYRFIVIYFIPSCLTFWVSSFCFQADVVVTIMRNKVVRVCKCNKSICIWNGIKWDNATAYIHIYVQVPFDLTTKKYMHICIQQLSFSPFFSFPTNKPTKMFILVWNTT